MENRHGLTVDGRPSEVDSAAERDQAQARLAAVPGRHRITVGGEKNSTTEGIVDGLQEPNGTSQIAQQTATAARRSTAGPRATRATR